MDQEDDASWFLEGYIEGERVPRRFDIKSFPFRIGRDGDVDALLPITHVSKLHAEIYQKDGELWLHDHASSNGTFVNRNRVSADVRLGEGDIVHFSTSEFVLGRAALATPEHLQTVLVPTSTASLPSRLVGGAPALRELIGEQRVAPYYQPIMCLGPETQTIGFELLGRGTHEALPQSPGELFRIAESAGLEAALSRLFRRVGIDAAPQLPGSPRLFVNSHPAELVSEDILATFRQARERLPDLALTLEVHEGTVNDAASMRELRSALTDLDIGLAYDDFGAGQSRLLELVEVPPDYLKFDISLIRDLHLAPPARQKMLQTLVSMVRDMEIACLAEGIERAEELEACRAIGFEFAQGYLLGRPAPVESWREAARAQPPDNDASTRAVNAKRA